MPEWLQTFVRRAAIFAYVATILVCALTGLAVAFGEAAPGQGEVSNRSLGVAVASGVGTLLTWRLWLNLRAEASFSRPSARFFRWMLAALGGLLVFVGVAYIASTAWIPWSGQRDADGVQLHAGAFAVGWGLASVIIALGALLLTAMNRKPAEASFPVAGGGIETGHD